MDALELSRRTAALMEDCLRVDAEGVALGVIDPENDPLYRDGQKLFRQTLRDARQWQAHWMLKARAPIVQVAQPRRAATTSRARPRARRRTRAGASRDGPSDEPPLAVIPPAEFRRELQRALGGSA